ncbi:MAG: MarR family transcriptional regulator [Planctomycetes bacterium]|nr:MarR family transcriptional regulator [Planctomycetota bacterium]
MIIRLASQKYYEDILKNYFIQMNRYAHEPFDRKLDRYVQHDLLKAIISEAKKLKRDISNGKTGGIYFKGLSTTPVSHCYVAKGYESFLASLEFNFLISRYHELRDKDGKDVYVYALFYGICEAENLSWGCPRERREDRSYYIQRCFCYDNLLRNFLSQRQTIRCEKCGASHPLEDKVIFERYNWLCPDCQIGYCSIVNIGDEYRNEIQSINKDLMLDTIDLEILQILYKEGRPMRAQEISSYIDKSYQMIGRRTSKLEERGLVEKQSMERARQTKLNAITDRAIQLYFGS